MQKRLIIFFVGPTSQLDEPAAESVDRPAQNPTGEDSPYALVSWLNAFLD